MTPPTQASIPTATGTGCATPGYGYIWASGYPWGYLPYQCGMWNFYDGFGWGWAPGMGMGMGGMGMGGMGMGFGSCNPWWGRGRYGGANIGQSPVGYRPIIRPVLRGPLGRIASPIIPVSRSFNGGTGGFPVRNSNSTVQIAGHTVEPLKPVPGSNSYVRSSSGFVYHPAGGYQGTRTVGEPSNPEPSSNARPAGGGRPGYTPAPAPVYTQIRTYAPPADPNPSPAAQGGNKPAPASGRTSWRESGEGSATGPGNQGVYQGGSFGRPSGGGNSGAAPAPRTSGGGGNSGGGGMSAPRSGSGGMSAPRGGGGGSPSGGGGSHNGH